MRSKVLRWGLSVLTMVSVATVLLLVTGWGSAMAAQITSVFVTNTSANPVPVNGSVNVGNLPATQPVSGSVNVGNTSTNPVPVSGSVNVGNFPSFPSTQTVNGTVTVGNSASSPVPAQITNTDNTGNIKVHEQGTASVNVTNNSLSTTSGDQTHVITSGDADIPAHGSTIVIGDGSRAGVDLSAYKTVTVYWEISSSDGSGLKWFVSTQFPGGLRAAIAPCEDTGCQPTAQDSQQTFDPAPPNMFAEWINSNSTTEHVSWLLVGRAN